MNNNKAKLIFLSVILVVSYLVNVNAKGTLGEINQSLETLKIIKNLRKDYLTINGAKVYLPNITMELHKNIKAHNNNNDTNNNYFYDSEIGKTNYKITGKNTENEKYILKEIKSILQGDFIPQDLLYNLKIFISPYSFDKVRGYSVIYNLDEAEDYIVIPSNLDFLEENLYHELGHIYWHNILNNHKELKVSFLTLYEKYYFNDDIWEYSIEENFAEDFKVYMFQKKGIKKDKRTRIPYDKKVEIIIEEYIEDIVRKEGKFFPEVILNVGNEKINLDFKNLSLNNLVLTNEASLTINDKNNKQIKIEVCRNLKSHNVNDDIVKLKYGENIVKVYYKYDEKKIKAGELNITVQTVHKERE